MATANEPIKILSVDDVPANLFAMRMLLEPLGYVVDDAQSGDQALALARSSEFALILLDVMMPVMDGIETLARLRATARLPNTPVILVTAADVDPSMIERAYDLGALDYITKPVIP